MGLAKMRQLRLAAAVRRHVCGADGGLSVRLQRRPTRRRSAWAVAICCVSRPTVPALFPRKWRELRFGQVVVPGSGPTRPKSTLATFCANPSHPLSTPPTQITSQRDSDSANISDQRNDHSSKAWKRHSLPRTGLTIFVFLGEPLRYNSRVN